MEDLIIGAPKEPTAEEVSRQEVLDMVGELLCADQMETLVHLLDEA